MARRTNTIQPINTAEARALAGAYDAGIEVKGWVEFRLTCTWADQGDSARVLKAPDLAAAKVEAAAARAVGLGIGHVTMKARTVQDLLAERRYNALEAHRETCPTAIAMLEAHIAMIDTEIESRREG